MNQNVGATGSEVGQAPQRVGPWVLGERLGAGGNATVYLAVREGTEEKVALKVIKTQKADREPYKRFAREVEFLRNLSIDDGVLPLIDANVPERPTRDNRAWLAMPVAQPIRVALVGASLETVVEAIATIAETLSRLADRGIAHRDIKPGNLYNLSDRWLVGDFGLIDLPNLEELTRTGRPLGPAYFTAHELIVSPESADGRLADVYSLGKTLWVLATEQNYPPGGHQPRGSVGYNIADMRPHPLAAQLDGLVDSMTQLRPELRPTMALVVRDLRAWQRMSKEKPRLSIDDVRARVRARLQPELEELDIQSQRIQQAQNATTRILELIDPLNRELTAIHPNAQLDLRYDDEFDHLLRSRPSMGRSPSVFNWYTLSLLESGQGPTPLQLKFGCGIELNSDGSIDVHICIICGYKGLGDAFYRLGEVRTAAVGSIEAEQALRSSIDELSGYFPEALEFLFGHLPEANS